MQNIIAETLKQIGFSILVNSVLVSCAFEAAAIIPIPALRYFVGQTAIVIAFITVALLVLFPAVIKLDLERSRSRRVDLFCCFKIRSDRNIHQHGSRYLPVNKHDRVRRNRHDDCVITMDNEPRAFTMPSSKDRTLYHKGSSTSVNSPFIPPKTSLNNYKKSSSLSLSASSLSSCTTEINQLSNDEVSIKRTEKGVFIKLTLTYLMHNVYVPLLFKKSFKLLTIIFSVVLLLVSITGLPKVRDGLDLTDIVPRDTSEYRFLHTQKRFFSVYRMYSVTQGNFEYPNNQKLLLEYYSAFTRIEKIIKNDDGGLPEFWLTMFRDWLLSLQNAFDGDWKRGSINQERWFPNASADGILAYKLLVQTGRVDNPVDKSLVSKLT